MYFKKIFIAVFVLFYFALFLSCEHVHFNSMYGGWRMGEMGGGGGAQFIVSSEGLLQSLH